MDVPGRDESFEEYFDSTFPLAPHVNYRIVADAYTAEDLAAEALVRAYVRWPRLRNDPSRIVLRYWPT